jgi:hypothetical protein
MEAPFWTADLIFSSRVVRNRVSLDKAEIKFGENGRWIYRNDDAILDGAYIFVMDQFGRLYIHDFENAKQIKFHHSGFLRGGDVAGAGTFIFENGKVSALSDWTGHYWKSFENNWQLNWRQVLKELTDRDKNMKGISLLLKGVIQLRLNDKELSAFNSDYLNWRPY